MQKYYGKSLGLASGSFHIFKEVLSISIFYPLSFLWIAFHKKDSLATVLLAKAHGEPLDEAVYCEVMFDKDISGEVPEHRDFIYETAIPTLERMGVKVIVLRSKKTYVELFTGRITRGPKKGMVRSFPLCGKCAVQRDCKVRPIEQYQKTLPSETVQYVGIAQVIMEQAVLQRKVHVIPATKPATTSGPRHSGRQRVAAYCRVSTSSEEQLNSYAAQKNYYTQKIEENPDWEMAGIFADEGLSSTSLKKRAEFNRMIAACKRGRIDMILTKSASRFARNTVDCLKIIRTLKDRGIAIIFEKENINTLTESSEFLVTLFSSFAQAESESIGKNIDLGNQQSMREGKIPFHYDKTLGYRKGPDGKPEIDPEEAETVRLIYSRYLEGHSLGDIQKELTEKGIPTARGIQGWSRQVVQNILTNEKYIGDGLRQKTFTTGSIGNKKVMKNRGEKPMYYTENNHPAIIPKDIFYRVKEEMSRRASKRKVMQKTGKTEQGKYSAKYALSELLVCGECGTPYKRCTWARNDRKRIVWRCVSRLEFGAKYCHNSPSMDEEKLHKAIVGALNEYGVIRAEIKAGVLELANLAQSYGRKGGVSLLDLKQRLDALTAEQAILLDEILKDMDNSELNAQLEAVTAEKQDILDRMQALEKDESLRSLRASRQQEMEEWLDRQELRFTEYEDSVTRRFVERITVVDADTIQVKIRDIDVVIERKLC